ncbi:MAG: hypothetical protein SFV15_02300 [Polyangiaceae bacterium]|nr:hypothetical protein [Polyangiaceae bacterium]
MKKLAIASWFSVATSVAHCASAQTAKPAAPESPKAEVPKAAAPKAQVAPTPPPPAPVVETPAPPGPQAETPTPSTPSGTTPESAALVGSEGSGGTPDAPSPASDFPPVLNPVDGAPEARPSEVSRPTVSAPRVIAIHEATPAAVTPNDGSSRKSRPLSTVFNGSLRTYFDVNGVWNLDDSYQLFDNSDVNWRFGVSAGYDLLKFGTGWVLSPELGWSHEGATGGPNSPQLSQKEITGDHFFSAIRGRYSLVSWLESFGRLQGGLAWTRVDLAASTAQADNFSIDDKAPEFQLGAGLQARTPDSDGAPPGESLSLGMMVEGGYQLAPALALKLERDPSAGQRFTVLTSDLGELSRSGPFIRFGAFARF